MALALCVLARSVYVWPLLYVCWLVYESERERGGREEGERERGGEGGEREREREGGERERGRGGLICII